MGSGYYPKNIANKEVCALAKQRMDRFTEIEERFTDYEVYDRHGEKIGKVDDLFVDEHDNPEYIGVKMGFLGMRSTLIPTDVARVDEGRRRIEVLVEKDKAKEGPAFDDDEEITPEYENRVRSYYGLGSLRGAADRGPRGGYYPNEELARTGRGGGSGRHPGTMMGDVDHERGEFREPSPEHEGDAEREDDLAHEDELRVQRTEEELSVGTREREAGAMRVRKRVRTDRERVRVPKRREEVRVERVPVEEREASEAEIGDDEVVVPVTEEEVVAEKRPMVKEEIRLRKDVAREEEVIEEDVRKEEVEIDDRTGRRGRPRR